MLAQSVFPQQMHGTAAARSWPWPLSVIRVTPFPKLVVTGREDLGAELEVLVARALYWAESERGVPDEVWALDLPRVVVPWLGCVIPR